MMRAAIVVLLLLSSTAPALAQARPLSLEQRMLLRCSAAFALVAHRQAAGESEALALPPLGQAGREFFVQAAARVMDEAGLDRAAITAALEDEARSLADRQALAAVLPACLSLLPPA